MSSTLVQTQSQPRFTKRYKSLTERKTNGITYTPKVLADFVAEQIATVADLRDTSAPLRILDPAVGDGELLLSLLEALAKRSRHDVLVYGFDTAQDAILNAERRIAESFPKAALCLEHDSFINFVTTYAFTDASPRLFSKPDSQAFDLIISNPPYVRTQIIGADIARELATSFDLTGRVDLYHAFLIGIGQALKPSGTAGVIVSNRFMTTKGGASVRAALRHRFALRHIWDLGDTKLFDAAVLPAVILADGRNGKTPPIAAFTSIYETSEIATASALNPIDALSSPGTVELSDLRRFRVQHGTLDDKGPMNGIWRIATDAGDSWLASVAERRWGTFSDIGKIRVGVKTCADKVFIRTDWDDLSINRPELLRPLTTHHIARRFKPLKAERPSEILYPHETFDGQRRTVDLSKYPNARSYLETHRATLERRDYVTEAGRRWYEIWVPQDPAAWSAPKLVFRDISERPTFWLDLDGTIVNGDCYWLTCSESDEPLLWLAAAVANSTFAEAFYDHRFNNKLYSGRRRFITQYVEEFPLPDPSTKLSKTIERLSREIYGAVGSVEANTLEAQLDEMIWEAFGLVKETRG